MKALRQQNQVTALDKHPGGSLRVGCREGRSPWRAGRITTTAPRFLMLLAVGALAYAPLARADHHATNAYMQSFGTGKQFKSTIERHTEGTLSAEDLHQASLLASQLLLHLNVAAQHLSDSRPESARPEVAKAESLAKVVRGLLPVTTTTTTVKDAQGNEVYRNVQRVQDDLIPIFAEDMAVKLVEPVIEAKSGEASSKGLRLADADLIRKSVLVDLGYIERKLKRSGELMAKPQEALAELTLAQAIGVHFHAHKEDAPLMDVQYALALAERMIGQKNYEAARDNLLVARQRLEAYRQLTNKAVSKPVTDLEKEIEKISGSLRDADATKLLRHVWGRVTSLFSQEPGQAHETAPPAKR
jgi:hypothetical protein